MRPVATWSGLGALFGVVALALVWWLSGTVGQTPPPRPQHLGPASSVPRRHPRPRRPPRRAPPAGGLAHDGRRELKSNRAQLQAIVNDLAPGLTEHKGIGPVSAAQVIVSFSHPGRCRTEAFAALGGTSDATRTGGAAEATE